MPQSESPTQTQTPAERPPAGHTPDTPQEPAAPATPDREGREDAWAPAGLPNPMPWLDPQQTPGIDRWADEALGAAWRRKG